jgi:catechol 2,3-dioxygenase-like lactoylglutathione lyase family enzyme
MITAMPRIAIAIHDFPKCLATFRDVLGMPVVDLSESSVASLGAKVAMCVPEGGSNIELMSPADPNAPLSHSLQKFLARRGEGLFALMLEAPDPDTEADALSGRGLNVLPLMAGAGGRDVHPNSTHGVLIRVYPVHSFRGHATAYEQDTDSPGLSGIARVIVAVHDLDHAVAVYGNKFALDIAEPTVDAKRGVRSAVCTPPSGGVIEFVSVANRNLPFAESVAEFLQSRGEGMYALVLQSHDLRRSTKNLTARGVEVHNVASSPDLVEIERASTFGTRIWIAFT